MNQYWIIAFIALLAGTFFLGDRYGADSAKLACDKIESAQQENTIDAQKHVIGQVETQGNISQEASKEYAKDYSDISVMYSTARMQSSPSALYSLRPLSASACGTQTTKKYRLTLQQCDQEEAKCNALWNWANQQAAVK